MRRLRIVILLLLIAGCQWLTAKDRLTAYPADSTANTGIAVIVCPGGSYC